MLLPTINNNNNTVGGFVDVPVFCITHLLCVTIDVFLCSSTRNKQFATHRIYTSTNLSIEMFNN
jgi:hypothetical protein